MGIIGRLRARYRAGSVSEPASSPYAGYVDEISAHHVAGWLTGPGAPGFEAVLPSGELVAAGQADQFKFGPSHRGEGRHGFFEVFSRRLTPVEQAALILRDPAGHPVARAPEVSGEYRPLMLNAMDIVDNCNLRCPFCVYDYSRTFATNTMDDATFAAATRFMPFTLDGNFWLSCLHEPALHPKFAAYLESVPAEWRRKVFFTSNFAKRMPAPYFDLLTNGGFNTLNISIESLQPELYERMRKGARHRIFVENWDALIRARDSGTAPPFLRYIVLVYRSNFTEIPDMVRHLLQERRADQIQLRFTFDVPHIPQEFRDSEYVSDADWDALEATMAQYPRDKVQVIRPGSEALNEAACTLPGRFEFKTSWDGTIEVKRFWAVPFDTSGEPPVAVVNVRDIEDPAAFFVNLTRQTRSAA